MKDVYVFEKKGEDVFLMCCFDFYNSDVGYGDMSNYHIHKAWWNGSFTEKKGKNAMKNILKCVPYATFKYVGF